MEILIFVLITFTPAGDISIRHEVLPASICAERLHALRTEAHPLKVAYCTRSGETYKFRRHHLEG